MPESPLCVGPFVPTIWPVRIVDLESNPRILILEGLLRELSVAQQPYEVLYAFARRYWQLQPIDFLLSLSVKGLPPGGYRITRKIDVQRVLRGDLPPQHTALPLADLPVHSSGLIGEMIAGGRPRLIYDLRLEDDPVLGGLVRDMRSAVFLPLFEDGEPRYWSIQFRRSPEGFTLHDLEQAAIISNLVGGTNTRLLLVQQVSTLNKALQQQFEEVAKVQRSLLPRRIPDVPGLQIATSYLTSDQAGGDYYDFFRFEDGTWGFLIADVSGHGAAAATIMAMFHGILHAYTGGGPGRSPDMVLRYANKKLYEAGLEGNFVTAFFAVYNPERGTLTYARGGHNPPLLKDGESGRVEHLEGEGAPPLGLFEPYEISSTQVKLKPGDTVILYTDGITEAFNASREMFGPQRLDAALTKCNGSPDCVVDSVHTALYQHTGTMTRADDQTLVAVRYVGS
jgi:phosphoserine phosphatase RsbU/P